MLRTVASTSFKRGVAVALGRGTGVLTSCPWVVNAATTQSTAQSFHSSSIRQNRFREQEPSTTREQQSLIAYHVHHNNPNLLGSLSVRHPSTPFVLGWGDVESELEEPVMVHAAFLHSEAESQMDIESSVVDIEEEADDGTMSMRGRNSRRPTKANHGKRPCNHFARHKKRSRYGRYRRQ